MSWSVWSAPLLFANPRRRFSRVEAHMTIDYYPCANCSVEWLNATLAKTLWMYEIKKKQQLISLLAYGACVCIERSDLSYFRMIHGMKWCYLLKLFVHTKEKQRTSKMCIKWNGISSIRKKIAFQFQTGRKRQHGRSNEGEDGIEKYVLVITVWNHEACWMMTNIGPERLIFFYPILTEIVNG